MKKLSILMILAGCFIFSAYCQHYPQDKHWQVVFEDNFTNDFTYYWGNDRWYKSYGVKNAGKENEVIYFSTYDNVSIENGKLVLRAQKQNSPPCNPPNGSCKYGGIHSYTSGSLVSNSKNYHYGYYEIYTKLPAGTGFFPAFWMWSHNEESCWYNEIDIFEVISCETNKVQSNAYWDFECPIGEGYGIDIGIGTIKHDYDFSQWHWYGLEWDKDKITWYIDRKVVRQIPNTMGGKGIQNPMHILISFQLAPWGCGINDSDFPGEILVDQCNAYKLKYDCAKNETINSFSDFANYNYAVKKSVTLGGNTALPLGSDISLRATDFIELQNGFTVHNGAELYLDNNPCVLTSIRQNE